MKFLLMVLVVVYLSSCGGSRSPIVANQGSSASIAEGLVDTKVVGTENMKAMVNPERFFEFVSPPKYINSNNSKGGYLSSCDLPDFGFLTVSEEDSKDVWLCDFDDFGGLFWFPQNEFRADFDNLNIQQHILLLPRSFGFRSGEMIYWGWYYPFIDSDEEGKSRIIDLSLTTFEIDKSIIRSRYKINFKDSNRNATTTSSLSEEKNPDIRLNSVDSQGVTQFSIFEKEKLVFEFSVEW